MSMPFLKRVRFHLNFWFGPFCVIDMVKASRPLIRVLVINDNVLWINNFIRDNEHRLIERASRPLVGFGVLIDNTIKGLTCLHEIMSRYLIK